MKSALDREAISRGRVAYWAHRRIVGQARARRESEARRFLVNHRGLGLKDHHRDPDAEEVAELQLQAIEAATLDPESILIAKQERQEIRAKVAVLRPRESAVITARWLDDTASLDDLAERYGVGRERIRQIEWNALRRLWRPLLSFRGKYGNPHRRQKERKHTKELELAEQERQAEVREREAEKQRLRVLAEAAEAQKLRAIAQHAIELRQRRVAQLPQRPSGSYRWVLPRYSTIPVLAWFPNEAVRP
jgi:RNA polymerase sigma factor (sigma-70 family)